MSEYEVQMFNVPNGGNPSIATKNQKSDSQTIWQRATQCLGFFSNMVEIAPTDLF